MVLGLPVQNAFLHYLYKHLEFFFLGGVGGLDFGLFFLIWLVGFLTPSLSKRFETFLIRSFLWVQTAKDHCSVFRGLICSGKECYVPSLAIGDLNYMRPEPSKVILLTL